TLHGTTSYDTALHGTTSHDTAPYDTAPFRAGEAADGTWPDATLHLLPVRPHDTDSRDSR
ncbi:glycosyl transferase, partial [Streptomyces sp. NPDC057424]